MTFGEYVAFYGLTRSEGLVLRYLGDAYRALRQTVPERARTDELDDIIEWLGAVVRQTDSSLLDEWEQLVDPDRLAADAAPDVLPPTPERITANERAFTGAGAQRDVPPRRAGRPAPLGAARRARGRGRSTMGRRDGARRWRTTSPSTTPSTPARTRAGRRCCSSRRAAGRWQVQQILGDPAGDHDWRIIATVDLAASDEEGELVLDVTGLIQL